MAAMSFPRALRVAVLPHNGLFEVAEDEQGRMTITGGLEAEYIEILSRSLGFQMDVSAPADGEWGRDLANGSWTGLVGMVLSNVSDLALGGIAVTEKRNEIIHYSAPYRYTYLTFATNLPPELPRFTAFLYPFTAGLWIALAVLVLTMPFAFRLLLRRKRSLGDHFFDTVRSLLYEPFTVRDNGPARDYLLTGAWLTGSMLLSFSYAATLLSFLTVPLSEPGVRDVLHLSELVGAGQFRAGAFKGTNVVNILRADQHPSIRSLADHIERSGNDIEPAKERVAEFYRSRKSALIAPEVYFRMNFPGALRISPEPVKCTAISIVTRKSFCCQRRLDSHIRRMFDSGLSQQIAKRTLTRIEIEHSLNRTAEVTNLTLNLEDFLGAFAFYFIGNALSIVVLLLEITVANCKKKKRR